jgi:hypothetical protein
MVGKTTLPSITSVEPDSDFQSIFEAIVEHKRRTMASLPFDTLTGVDHRG